jgi:hypothetical protein
MAKDGTESPGIVPNQEERFFSADCLAAEPRLARVPLKVLDTSWFGHTLPWGELMAFHRDGELLHVYDATIGKEYLPTTRAMQRLASLPHWGSRTTSPRGKSANLRTGASTRSQRGHGMCENESVTTSLAVGEVITSGTAQLTAHQIIHFATAFDPQPMHID